MNLLELAGKIGIAGFLHCNELARLVELAAGRDVLEIGSYKGLSAWGMALAAKSLTCVDTFRAATDGQRQTDRLTTLGDFLRATSRYRSGHVRHIVTTSADATDILRGDYDMVFIDALHAYADVKADILRWWPRVQAGGVLAMHDYGHSDWPGVKQAADEVFGPAKEEDVCVTLRVVRKP